MPEHKRPRAELQEMIGHGSDMRVYADADPHKGREGKSFLEFCFLLESAALFNAGDA